MQLAFSHTFERKSLNLLTLSTHLPMMSIRKKKKHRHFYFSIIINHKSMSIAMLRQAGLLLHIIGLTMAAGVTLVSYIASRKFLAQYRQDKERGFANSACSFNTPEDCRNRFADTDSLRSFDDFCIRRRVRPTAMVQDKK